MAKIKHWQGYGSLDAKKVAEYPYGPRHKKAVVIVQGDHEYGVVREDSYDVHSWLCKRFVKDCESYRDICDVNIVPFKAEGPDGNLVDTAVYEITYRV